METLVPLPILIHLAAAIACVCCWRAVNAQRVIAVVASAAALGSSIALLLGHADGQTVTPLYVAGWAAPYGITLVIDLFSAIMLTLTGAVGLCCVIFALGSIDERREKFGFYPLVMAMLAACCGAFTSGDLFNIYVWFEVMLMSSFALLTLGGARGQLEGAIKYVTLNLVSSTIFLVGVGLLYGMTGTLNIADLSLRLSAADPTTTSVIAVLFLVAFGIKAGAFPLYFWLPASYHTPPTVVSALFGGLLTKVGVYAMIRVFCVVFLGDRSFTTTILLWMAALTMISGGLGAICQAELRRLLSFQLVGSIGFMLMGLGVAMIASERASAIAAEAGDSDPAVIALRTAAGLSLAGAILYTAHHMIVKTGLFLVAGITRRIMGHNELQRLGGLYRSHPKLSLLFMTLAMSLAGMPMLSGFWSKLALVRGGLQTGAHAPLVYWVVGIGLAAGVLTFIAMTKIWNEVFWKDLPEHERGSREQTATSAGASPLPEVAPAPWRLPVMAAPAVALTLATLAIGFAAAPAFDLCARAAEQLLEPDRYVTAVLPEEYRMETIAQIEAIKAGVEYEPVLATVPVDDHAGLGGHRGEGEGAHP